MKDIFHQFFKICHRNFGQNYLETELGYDVIIYVGEEPNVKEIHVHSNILSIRSQYFVLRFRTNGWKKMMENLFLET